MLGALKNIFVTAFFKGTQLVAVFWCLNYIFLGSIMTYVVMLVYNRLNNKVFFFSLLTLLLFFVDQAYLPFVAGIFAAIIANKEYPLKKSVGGLLVLGGCILGVFPPHLASRLHQHRNPLCHWHRFGFGRYALLFQRTSPALQSVH